MFDKLAGSSILLPKPRMTAIMNRRVASPGAKADRRRGEEKQEGPPA
jgi:hypothetical protein